MDSWSSFYYNLEPSLVSIKKNLQRLKRLGFFEIARPDDLILDLFCGRCDTCVGLRNSGYRVINGDFSFELLQSNATETVKAQLNSLYLPFKSDLVDAVIVQGGLHHLASVAQIKQCLNEIQRILKPGGRLYVSEPANTKLLSVWLFLLRKTPLWKLTPYSRNWRYMYMEEEETHSHYLRIVKEVYLIMKQDWEVEHHSSGLVTEFFRLKKPQTRADD